MLGSSHCAFAPSGEMSSLSQYGMAESAELKILANAVSDYCAKHKITDDQERDAVAIRVMGLYRQGIINPAHISAKLEGLG